MKRFIAYAEITFLACITMLVSACSQAPEDKESAAKEDQASVTEKYVSPEIGNLSTENSAEQNARTGSLDVIMIHGWGNVFDNQTWASDTLSEVYWAYWTTRMQLMGLNVKHIEWDTKRRINDQFDEVVDQYQSYLNSGHCANGCAVITHSTGGLLMDMLLARSYDSYNTANDFSDIWESTTVVVEIASAAGGVSVAEFAVDVGMGVCNNWVVEQALKLLIPFVECGQPDSVGATYDLVPSVARSINRADDGRTPVLMVAGFGNFTGNILKPFLKGTSDGVVAMHSSCGSNQFGSYESCVSNMGPDGHLASYDAPNGNYTNHFPYMMTKEGHGSELAPGLVNTDLFSKKTETLIDNHGYSDLSNSQYTSGAWWWKKVYKRISQGENHHLSTVILDHFNF